MDVWPKVRERPSDSTFILESHACLSPPLAEATSNMTSFPSSLAPGAEKEWQTKDGKKEIPLSQHCHILKKTCWDGISFPSVCHSLPSALLLGFIFALPFLALALQHQPYIASASGMEQKIKNPAEPKAEKTCLAQRKKTHAHQELIPLCLSFTARQGIFPHRP